MSEKKCQKKEVVSPEVKLHPFFEMLFSEKYTPPAKLENAHVFVAMRLDEIFEGKTTAEDVACQVFGLYEAIKHHPDLQQEAAAMLAYYRSQDILQRFTATIA